MEKKSQKQYFIPRIIGRVKSTANSLSNLVNNLAEAIYKSKCENEHDHEKCENFRIKDKDCDR